MAQKLETDIVLNLAGNLAAKARQYGNSMGEFAKKNQKAMTLVKTSTAAAGRGIDALGNRYVGLAATFVTGATVRNVAAFDAQMVRIGTNAKLSSDQVDVLTQSIEDFSTQADIRIDTTTLATGVDTLLGKTGDLEFVMDNLENMGVFMQAFGADAESTGALFAQFREKGIRDSEAVMKTIDELYGQFAIGSVSVKDLAGISEQLFATYQAKGPEAITQMSALVQLFAKAKGNANESLTSIQAVFATFSDKKKVEFLDKQGIAVFKEGTKELREPVELLLEVLDAAKNDPLKLGDVFDQTSLQGLSSIYSQENKDLLLQMTSGTGELGATQEAAAKNAATLNSAMTSLNNSFNKFANQRLAEPIQELADAINSVDDETIQNWLKWGETALWVVGGLVAAKKGLDIAASVKTVFGKGGVPGAGGKGGFQDLGAMPVFVVNMPGGGMSCLGGDLPDGKSPKGGKPSKSRFMSLSNLAAATTVGYGLSIIPDFSPINVRRQSEVDRSQLPEGFPVSAGLMDVVDDFKSWFSSSSSNEGTVNNPYLSSNTGGNINVDVSVSDDRITTKVTSSSPTIQIDPDTGTN
ncbi:phage tail tape measure protein [Vibrio europaeus]|uniref:Phage tail tape measure protein n=1 Tax=Vibrio europaeus TaxID=300876 RepID=A0A178J996_9VIBR|nr:phage tail tape measure protein [Vibrio europaeus]MDC5843762.1 phage tail tape measure protein [Vibrio europaeus]MDC5860858.1 phage tail tape measure protein [Vibrio europaeus]MDC5866291.1 phage tail tape measure protein [Vibrio europaeus]OAM98108.1 phage tail tape measure protein [Vibrio europaeus]